MAKLTGITNDLMSIIYEVLSKDITMKMLHYPYFDSHTLLIYNKDGLLIHSYSYYNDNSIIHPTVFNDNGKVYIPIEDINKMFTIVKMCIERRKHFAFIYDDKKVKFLAVSLDDKMFTMNEHSHEELIEMLNQIPTI